MSAAIGQRTIKKDADEDEQRGHAADGIATADRRKVPMGAPSSR